MAPDMRQSAPYAELMRRSGARVLELGGGHVGFAVSLAFVPLARYLLVQRVSDPAVLSAVDRLARRRLYPFVKVAPKALSGSMEASIWDRELRQHGFVPDRFPAAPTRTLLLDLALSDEELLEQMKAKTRYNIRLSERRGVTARVVDGSVLARDAPELDAFYRVFVENARRLGEQPPPLRYLRVAAEALGSSLFAVFAHVKEGALGAVASFIVAGDTVTYMLNGSTEQGRHDFATNRAVWEAMREGKRRGCRWLDLDGLSDERFQVTEAWQGFTRFKLGFGGQEVTFMGSYIRWWPFLGGILPKQRSADPPGPH